MSSAQYGPLAPAAARILSMPVVFTDEAWQQAVQTIPVDNMTADLGDRLSCALAAAYKAALVDPHKTVVSFGVHRMPPDGDINKPLWVDLQVSHHDDPLHTNRLLISLKQPLRLEA
ncbi:hypothetical protein BVH03_17890 [Pseudomonas sp. PA15(2017)]|uniref:hypothetical protein n=1 Tax=Pseudomonas sp. PA15(2017) TaxID=1932111 RepID=UPI0009598E33|nr:hypothetical protein [Pseudomonas sp. PA15(2017)]OLU25520.1 hypothetical protein BVH03_17890 [Pseudomonas sp. PA15(2017)]